MKIFSAFCLLAMAQFARAEGWTELTRITSIGQYGYNVFMAKIEETVLSCADPKQLYWITQDASDAGKFYSALLAAYVSGSRVKIYLHDPVDCTYDAPIVQVTRGKHLS